MGNIKKKIPNIITGTRIISAIVAPILFLNGYVKPAIILYLYGTISDFFDGYFARKFNAITEFGKFLDATSDKLFCLSILLPAILSGNRLMYIPLLLEGIISLINSYSVYKGNNPITEIVGKIKTGMLFPTSILGLIFTINTNVYSLFLACLIITTILEIISIYKYVIQYNVFTIK